MLLCVNNLAAYCIHSLPLLIPPAHWVSNSHHVPLWLAQLSITAVIVMCNVSGSMCNNESPYPCYLNYTLPNPLQHIAHCIGLYEQKCWVHTYISHLLLHKHTVAATSNFKFKSWFGTFKLLMRCPLMVSVMYHSTSINKNPTSNRVISLNEASNRDQLHCCPQKSKSEQSATASICFKPKWQFTNYFTFGQVLSCAKEKSPCWAK